MTTDRSVAFVVNGGERSAMGYRARAFTERTGEALQPAITYRASGRLRAIAAFWAFLVRRRPSLVYVFDMSAPGVIAAWLYKAIFGAELIIDTGDAIHALTVSTGNRSRVAAFLVGLFERFSLRAADRLVVRAETHRDYLAARGLASVVIPDGVDTAAFRPFEATELRKKLGLNGETTIGLVGSVVWSRRLEICYGWDLVEALYLLRDLPVRGLVVGDGTGLDRLRQRCQELGIEDRITFLGRVAFEKLPEVLNAMDFCLSTQTNNLAGQVRTTGKLPLYLACGRRVLASRVGEAERLLPERMLVRYDGEKDLAYPARVAERIRQALAAGDPLEADEEARRIALTRFDYDRLAERFEALFEPARLTAEAI